MTERSRIPRRASRTYEYAPSGTTIPARAGQHMEEDQEDVDVGEADEPPYERLPTSVIRYTTPKGQQVIQRGNQRIVIHQGKPGRHYPWIFLICIGMIIALALVYALSALGVWWTNHQLDATYGFPRTYQTDAIVYAGDSADHPSHYIFLNLGGTVQIIELPHDDSADARIYRGPTLMTDHADFVPVTGVFKTVNGKEEMIVHIGDQEIIYINNGQKFVPQQ